MNVQARVAIDKQKHPERYCAEPKCLWKVAELVMDAQYCEGVIIPATYRPKVNCPGGRCPRHQPFRAVIQEMTREEFEARYPKGKP